MEKKHIFDDYMDEVTDGVFDIKHDMYDVEFEIKHYMRAEELNFFIAELKNHTEQLEKAINRELYRRMQAEMKANPRAYIPLEK